MRSVGLLLFLVVGAFASASTIAEKQKSTREEESFGATTWAARLARARRNLARKVEMFSDSPGTETVLLVKGGVGVDLDLRQDLLSTRTESNIFKKPKHHTVKAKILPKHVQAKPKPAAASPPVPKKAEEDSVDTEVAAVAGAADAAGKLSQQLRLVAKQANTAKRDYKTLQKENAALKDKLAKEDVALKAVEADAAAQKREVAEFAKEKKALWSKVKSLEEDMLLTNEAWKERATEEEMEIKAIEKAKEAPAAKVAPMKKPRANKAKPAPAPKKATTTVAKKQEVVDVPKKVAKKVDHADEKAGAVMKTETTKFSNGLKAAMSKAIASVAKSFVKAPTKPLPPAPAAVEHVYEDSQDDSSEDTDDDDDDSSDEKDQVPVAKADDWDDDKDDDSDDSE